MFWVVLFQWYDLPEVLFNHSCYFLWGQSLSVLEGKLLICLDKDIWQRKQQPKQSTPLYSHEVNLKRVKLFQMICVQLNVLRKQQMIIIEKPIKVRFLLSSNEMGIKILHEHVCLTILILCVWAHCVFNYLTKLTSF